MSRRPMRLALALALAVGTTACAKNEPAKPAEAPAVLTVSTAPVAMRAMSRSLDLTGSVAAWDPLPVMPAANGLRVMDILVDEGDVVKRGQLLAKLDDATLSAQLAQARARVATAKAQLASAEDTYTRFAGLAEEGGVSASEMVSRRTAVETASAQLAEANAAVANFEALVSQTRVTAPADGYIMQRDAHLGDVSTVGRALFHLIRDSRLEVEALMPEADLGRIRPGQSARITSDALPDLAASGTVREIKPQLDAQSRQATVEIDLPKHSAFKVGMFVRASVNLGTQEALAVPTTAVVARETGNEVFILDGQVARARKIEIGERQGGWITVNAGLSPGEQLIVSGVGFLKDGDKVDVAPALQSANP